MSAFSPTDQKAVELDNVVKVVVAATTVSPEVIKVAAVGDGGVGKTNMILSYVNNTFTTDLPATVMDTYSVQLVADGKPCTLLLLDTAGQEEYSRMRPLAYENTDVFLLCFSVVSRPSFNNLKQWVTELSHHGPDIPVLIVGTQHDRRQEATTNSDVKQMVVVSAKEAETFAQLHSNLVAGYMECSASTQDGLKPVFDTAVRLALDRRRKRLEHNSGWRKWCGWCCTCSA